MRRLRINVIFDKQRNKFRVNTHYSMKRPLDVIKDQSEPEEA
jgi:hypothetical protein